MHQEIKPDAKGQILYGCHYGGAHYNQKHREKMVFAKALEEGELA